MSAQTMNLFKDRLRDLGMTASGFYNEKWFDPQVGIRTYAVDVGSSYREVRVRVHLNGEQKDSLDVTTPERFEEALAVIAQDLDDLSDALVAAEVSHAFTVVGRHRMGGGDAA
jgi:hypothetical protein